MKIKIFVFIISIMLVIAPVVFSQEEATPAPEIKNNVDINGDVTISSEGEITVVPTVIDKALHNEALVLKSIGTPLYKTGEILVGVSVATWVVWAIAVLPGLLGTSIDSLLPGAGIALATVSPALLGVSIGLTSAGLAALISGGVMNVVGDARREQSFATIE